MKTWYMKTWYRKQICYPSSRWIGDLLCLPYIVLGLGHELVDRIPTVHPSNDQTTIPEKSGFTTPLAQPSPHACHKHN